MKKIPEYRPLILAGGCLGMFGLLMGLLGCPQIQNPTNPNPPSTDTPPDGTDVQTIAGQCSRCHSGIVEKYLAGSHKSLQNACLTCHENGQEHMASPIDQRAKVNFALSACASCHRDQYDTYLYDDASKAGHFGGSIPTSKYEEFPHYTYLMGGHGFTRQYNEERSHGYILKDHIETLRRQTTACLQCKSTPVAYYWDEDSRGAIQFEKTQTWSDVVQRLRDEHPEMIDYGTGCTHCHDPHNGDFRLIRKGLITAILERGTDPYSSRYNIVPSSQSDLENLLNERGADGKRTQRAMRLAGTLTCAQCHIEYVCGQGADRATTGEIRDDIPWRKLEDIEDYYRSKFSNQQDWTHGITGLTGIKPQHPETEAYWGSSHHMLGMSCSDCHMAPMLTADGRSTRSHWLTSPLKNNIATCGQCHDDAEAELLALQDDIYAQAREVERTLNTLLQKIEAANTSGDVPADRLLEAKTLFMRALTWWEWTAVSENSMGAHNADDARKQLDQAQRLADEALQLLP